MAYIPQQNTTHPVTGSPVTGQPSNPYTYNSNPNGRPVQQTIDWASTMFGGMGVPNPQGGGDTPDHFGTQEEPMLTVGGGDPNFYNNQVGGFNPGWSGGQTAPAGGSVTGQAKPDFWFNRPGFGEKKPESPVGMDYAQNVMDMTRKAMPEPYDPSAARRITRSFRTPGRDYGTPKSFNYGTMQEAMADQPGYASSDYGLIVGQDSPLGSALMESLRKNKMIEDQYGSVSEWEAMGKPSFTGGTSALDVLNGAGTQAAPVSGTSGGTSAFNVLNNAMSGVQPAGNRFWEQWGRG